MAEAVDQEAELKKETGGSRLNGGISEARFNLYAKEIKDEINLNQYVEYYRYTKNGNIVHPADLAEEFSKYTSIIKKWFSPLESNFIFNNRSFVFLNNTILKRISTIPKALELFRELFPDKMAEVNAAYEASPPPTASDQVRVDYWADLFEKMHRIASDELAEELRSAVTRNIAPALGHNKALFAPTATRKKR
jgi:hypothetical protein